MGGVAESAGRYVDRTGDAERPIPHVCFKIPTGGGKTLLAAAALEKAQSSDRPYPLDHSYQGHLSAN